MNLKEIGELVRRGDIKPFPPENEAGETFTPQEDWDRKTTRQRVDALREFYSPQKG